MLTSYDGIPITYDEIGNPETYGDIELTWKKGRQLESLTIGDMTVQYRYNSNGQRTKKIIGDKTIEYFYSGNALVAQYDGTTWLKFIYSADGEMVGFTVDDTPYYYIKNLQGDVVKLADENGNIIAEYSYDAWGYPGTTTYYGTDTTESQRIANLNPIRYRGYYYDKEVQFYYLNSRYYVPLMGRFLNADRYASTGQGVTGSNMFAYCGNNPVNRVDTTGTLWDYVLDAAFLAWSLYDVYNDPTNWKNWLALGVDVVFAVIPFIPSGVGQVVKIGNNIDNAGDVIKAINKLDNLNDITNVTMIGRNMKRVENVASVFGISDNLYNAWYKYNDYIDDFPKLTKLISSLHDGFWTYSKLRQGYTVIDIGVTTVHKGVKGIYYGMECTVIGIWQSRHLWKIPIHHTNSWRQ